MTDILHTFFAVDLGATSGRTLLGTINDGHLTQRELTRFPNKIIEVGGQFYWDIYALYSEIIHALRLCADEGITPTSTGIDSWGVDFLCRKLRCSKQQNSKQIDAFHVVVFF